MYRLMMRLLKIISVMVFEIGFLFIAFFLSRISRNSKRPIDIGLGPQPLINNVYHKRALEKKGYSTETYVLETWYITAQFDVKPPPFFKGWLTQFIPYYFFIRTLFKYRCLYIYFVGGASL